MTKFCNPGDTARVTFPNLAIVDYADTPIDITCDNDECTLYQIVFKVTIVTPGYGSNTSNYTVYCRNSSPSSFSIRINGLKVEIFCRGNANQCVAPNWVQVLSIGAFPGRYLENAQILSAIPDPASPAPKKRIKIIGNSGASLHNVLYSNCNYSVECIKNCPPDTLDCGDCCLDCKEILTQVCNIKILFLGS